jgi:hypothetical protein
MEVPLCVGDAHPGTPALPLLDPSVLDELEDELPGAARRFAGDFARLWGRRRDRLAETVAARAKDEALDAVLSLKVSSMMVGAQRLARVAACLESSLRTGEGDAGVLCGQIAECGSLTVDALREAWPEDPES